MIEEMGLQTGRVVGAEQYDLLPRQHGRTGAWQAVGRPPPATGHQRRKHLAVPANGLAGEAS